MPPFHVKFQNAARELNQQIDALSGIDGMIEALIACRKVASSLENGGRLGNLARRLGYLHWRGGSGLAKAQEGSKSHSKSNVDEESSLYDISPESSFVPIQSKGERDTSVTTITSRWMELESQFQGFSPLSFLLPSHNVLIKPTFHIPLDQFLYESQPQSAITAHDSHETHDPYLLDNSELYILPKPNLPPLSLRPIIEEDDNDLESPSTPKPSSVLFINPFAVPSSEDPLPTPPATPSRLEALPPHLNAIDEEGIEEPDLSQPMNLTGKVAKLSNQAIAYGGASDIYQGLWRSPEPKQVAIKILRATNINHITTVKRRLRRELDVWWMCRHQNIVPLFGFVSDFSSLDAMVSPWMKNGSVSVYAKTRKCSWVERIKLLNDVAAGLQYLHHFQPPIIHGDLKPTNVLVSDNGDACLCDFGLARVIRSEGGASGFTTSNFAGSVRYMAPELFDESEDDDCLPNVTMETDVYALGCVALELVTDKVPYTTRNNDSQVIYDIIRGVLPARQPSRVILAFDSQSRLLWDMLMATWRPEPHRRPDIMETIKMIDECVAPSDTTRRLSAQSLPRSHSSTSLRGRASVRESSIPDQREPAGGLFKRWRASSADLSGASRRGLPAN